MILKVVICAHSSADHNVLSPTVGQNIKEIQSHNFLFTQFCYKHFHNEGPLRETLVSDSWYIKVPDVPHPISYCFDICITLFINKTISPMKPIYFQWKFILNLILHCVNSIHWYICTPDTLSILQNHMTYLRLCWKQNFLPLTRIFPCYHSM